jgi:hypothetical protein
MFPKPFGAALSPLAAVTTAVLTFSLSAPEVAAQDQDGLIAKREKKLAKDVFHKTPWMFDYDEARAKAKKEGKVLFAYFTRSYAY